jgi:GTPase
MNAGLVDLFGDCDTSSDDGIDITDTSLPPEVEKGNVEYKLKLIDPSPVRFEHLVTQMKWRLQEGLGEAIYEIGVLDNGILFGLNDEEMNKSLDTLRK